MRCLRCGGLMVCDLFPAGGGQEMAGVCEGWRCVNCGEMMDAVIFQNRQQREVEKMERELAASGVE